ncbi:hypothetical protein ACJJTC_007688 [Scirpophaga incertulas]
MRARSETCRGRAGQRARARGGARTMPRRLPAGILCMVYTLAAAAWTPTTHAHQPNPRHPTNTTRHLQLLGWHLELQENRAIRSPYYDECQFYRGRVLHEEGSSATVTECAGQLYGLLQVGNEEFVLQPNQPGSNHVLRRRDVMWSDYPAEYNLTGDTVTDLELDFQDEDYTMPHVRPRNSDYSDVEYFREIRPITRPVSGVNGLWLEMAIVADHTMLKFHGRERVKHYILALMNIVSAIFNDPSLDANITLVINKLFLYEEKDPIIKFGNVKKSLEAVNKWNYRHLMKLPSGSTGWDATVWLTRAPLGGPSGFAPVGGVCSRTRSAAIDRDEGLTSAFVIAHELAHLLGLTHDGEDQCEKESLKGSVMAPTVLATLQKYVWSSCSKEQFHEKSRKWWCLHERSQDEGVELGGAKEISNYIFTMEEQCRTEFGDGFSVCKTMKLKSACSRLWCAHKAMPHVCRSKRAPPMEGTPCGPNKWCVDRVCEPMPGQVEEKSKEEPTIPQWDDWGPWSECSADCGYGLRRRIRRCRYKGTGLEGACEGAGTQAATCWSGSPCADNRDVRADLCSRQDRLFIPYIHSNETRHCEIWCVQLTGGEAATFGALPDGSACSYDRPYDICLQGACVKGQCNGTDPVCNWCPDGYCNNNTHVYSRMLGKGWTRMAVIPHDAHQVSVHISTPVPLRIALRERKRDRHILELNKHRNKRFETDHREEDYYKYNPNVPQNLQIVEVDQNVIDIEEGSRHGWQGAAVAASTLFMWNQTDSDVFITANSRLATDLMIMAVPEQPLPVAEITSVQVSVNHSTPSIRSKPLEYRWPLERGPCSVSCGGGLRVVRPRCPHGQRCAPTRYERCNSHSCEFKWIVGEWEVCSATCGSDGVQERQLFCMPGNYSGSSRTELIRHSVSPALCPGDRPAKHQSCNHLPCPVYWQEMPWTSCSTTCGRGVSYRPLVCPASEDLYCGPKPKERKRRCRLRRCPTHRTANICSAKDATQYCEFFSSEELQRNCEVPPFRKYCCNTCRDVENALKRNVG